MEYKIMLTAYVETNLSLQEVKDRFDLWLLKYWIDNIIPEWDKQSISLEWYELIDYEDFRVIPICEECLEELDNWKCYNYECYNFTIN